MACWVERRLLLEPAAVPWAESHAALPATDVDPEGVLWLYFSPRDAEGRAHIARAPLEERDGELIAGPVAEEPVLSPGSLGAFDDSGVTMSCVVADGHRRLLYYSGWSLGRTVPFYFYVGLAVSEDGGRNYARVSPAPVLGRSATDPYLTASPAVLREDDRWRMWYVSGTEWELVDDEPRHRYRVHYAESSDGVDWAPRPTAILDYADPTEYAISRPCVTCDGDAYRMWFSARGDTYRLGYAESHDGLSWTRDDALEEFPPAEAGWDSEMIAYPWVFDHAGQRYLLYNGNGFGRTGIGVAREGAPR